MISTSVIQLQLFRNQLSLNDRFSASIRIIESSPHGNKRNEDVFCFVGVGMVKSYKTKVKNKFSESTGCGPEQ